MTDTKAYCPECGEPVIPYPPLTWTPALGPRPAYSHRDREPLCPVPGDTGSEPAQPVDVHGQPLTTPADTP